MASDVVRAYYARFGEREWRGWRTRMMVWTTVLPDAGSSQASSGADDLASITNPEATMNRREKKW
jgi:hypothetical protein